MDHPPKRSASPRHWLLFALSGALAAAAAIAVVFLLADGDSGGDSGGDPERLSVAELPSDAVAVVASVESALGTVTEEEFTHSLDQAVAQTDLDAVPKPGEPEYGSLRKTALTTLLESIWIEGEAGERGIVISDREVADELEKLTEESFDSEGEYEKFLRESSFTAADVDTRVRTQLFSTRLQEEIGADAGAGGEKAKQDAFQAFIRSYSRKWRSRTVCAPAYATEQCSNGKP